MITKYGMSEQYGPIYHTDADLEKLSPSSREAVETEVKALCQRADANARRILTEHNGDLHKLAKVSGQPSQRVL